MTWVNNFHVIALHFLKMFHKILKTRTARSYNTFTSAENCYTKKTRLEFFTKFLQ